MSEFFPPGKLPPVKGLGEPGSESGHVHQPAPSQAKRVGVFCGFSLFGLVVAVVGLWVTGGVQWVLALPVSAALGWYVAVNWSRCHVGSVQANSESGPVLW
jgi:hypothetical protein